MSTAAVAALTCLALCSAFTAVGGTSSDITIVRANVQHTAALDAIERFGAWWKRPTQPLEVQPLLPESRPQQPWPYRSLSSAQHSSITLTESYALQASVVHAPLKGVSAEMMSWWLSNIEGDAPYAGDGKVWPKYLQWHPRDHIYQVARQPPADSAGGSSSSSSSSSSSQPSGPLWEICEFFMCPQPGGFTAANYQPGPQHDGDYIIREVTELVQLGSHSMALTVPTRWGIGSSLWRLEHSWRDTAQGLVVSSSQVVGVVEPGWRPLAYARGRNALVRGMFARGRDAEWMLKQWIHHCVEEVGNLEHILPSLYSGAAAAAAATAGAAGTQQTAPRGDVVASGSGGQWDEL